MISMDGKRLEKVIQGIRKKIKSLDTEYDSNFLKLQDLIKQVKELIDRGLKIKAERQELEAKLISYEIKKQDIEDNLKGENNGEP